MSVSRSTISFSEENWKKISDEKNKSKLINTALRYFFDAQDYLKQAEQNFILDEWQHYKKTEESYTFDETFN